MPLYRGGYEQSVSVLFTLGPDLEGESHTDMHGNRQEGPRSLGGKYYSICTCNNIYSNTYILCT